MVIIQLRPLAASTYNEIKIQYRAFEASGVFTHSGPEADVRERLLPANCGPLRAAPSDQLQSPGGEFPKVMGGDKSPASSLRGSNGIAVAYRRKSDNVHCGLYPF